MKVRMEVAMPMQCKSGGPKDHDDQSGLSLGCVCGYHSYNVVTMVTMARENYQSHGPRGDGLGNVFIICAQWIVLKVDLGMGTWKWAHS